MDSNPPSPDSSPTPDSPISPTNSTPSGSNPKPPSGIPPSSSPAPPSNSTAPPPESSPPPIPSASPPSPVATPPPESLPQPPPPLLPPPSLPIASPPPPPLPPTLPPPAPVLPPPPPQALPSDPPSSATSPPSPVLSPPPPLESSPPKESPEPPVVSPPSTPRVPLSPPPPASDPPLAATSPPPPSVVSPPKKTPSRHSSPPPPSGFPSPSTPRSPPPRPSPAPPATPLPPPPGNSSLIGSNPVPPQPPFSTEKPTAGSTQPIPNIAANATSGNSRGLNSGGVAAVGSIVGFLALSLIVLAVLFTKRQKKRMNRYAMPSPFASSQKSDSSFIRPQHSPQLAGSASTNNSIYSPDGGIGTSRPWFTYDELSGATNGFSSYNLLGEGGFGCVYKGVLMDGREVAVKQLKAGGGQGEREFRAEVEIISRIHHRHLVSLVGYCISEHQRLLVYDYVPNDTLYYHLHVERQPVMDWATRVKIAAGAARGLAYLHEDCQPRIIHRDIKSSNILLDSNFEARVADFGLAKLALELDVHTHVSTRVMGTFGYLAPEYASSGKLTEKSDVYSFGVVLLELITGRKPVDESQPLGEESLVEWARTLLSRALETEDFVDLVAPMLEMNFTASEMFRMIEAAAVCVRHSAAKRPRMSQVVRALDSMDELADLSNGMKPGQSAIYNSREHSAQIRMFERMAFGSQDLTSDGYRHSQGSRRS